MTAEEWLDFWKTDYGLVIQEHARLCCAQLEGRDSKKKREAVFKRMMAYKREWKVETI